MIIAYKIRRQGEPSFLIPNDEPAQQKLLTKLMKTFPNSDILTNNTKNSVVNEKIEPEEEIVTLTNGPVLRVSPNPASENISITFTGDLIDAELTIVNAIGKVILKEKLLNNSVIKSLGGQPIGIYIVTIVNDGKIYSKQIVLE